MILKFFFFPRFLYQCEGFMTARHLGSGHISKIGLKERYLSRIMSLEEALIVISFPFVLF